MSKAICASCQSELRFEHGYFEREFGQFRLTDIGQVGNNELHWFRQGLKQVALEQPDSIAHLVFLTIALRHFESSSGNVSSINICLGKVQGECYRDGSTAGADIGNEAGFRKTVVSQLDCLFDE